MAAALGQQRHAVGRQRRRTKGGGIAILSKVAAFGLKAD
jgi:hypothetical protein